MPETRYVILLTDGAADLPVARMGGLTPLQVARTPVMDALAASGRCGTLATVPPGMPADSATANMSVLGYDPRISGQGRGVLEAASQGVPLGPDDVALRFNLISVEDGRIADHSAGHIGTDEALQLVAALAAELDGDGVELHPGISYRHLLVLRGRRFSPALECFPPHDHVGRPVAESHIRALEPAAERTAALLNRLTAASVPILDAHPVNRARRAAGKRAGDTIWPWAPGRPAPMSTLQERFGIRGAVISAVDLVRGLGRLAGMDSILVEGATGLYDTNYEGKARAALDALDDHDLVFVHVEGADEAGHARDIGLKIHCLESVDRRLLKPLVEGLERRPERVVIAVLPDHLTPVERGDHLGEPVPVLIADPERPADGVDRFDEDAVLAGSLGKMRGADFVEELFWRTRSGR